MLFGCFGSPTVVLVGYVVRDPKPVPELAQYVDKLITGIGSESIKLKEDVGIEHDAIVLYCNLVVFDWAAPKAFESAEEC
jgi:hypothetical protein